MKYLDYSKFSEQELQTLHEAAQTISFAFHTQFPGFRTQLDLLKENEQFRAANQLIIETSNALRKKYIARGINPDAPDFVPDHLEK